MLAKYISQSVFYSTPIGTIGDIKIAACNAAAPALFGFTTPAELVGHHMSYLQPPEWRIAGHQRYMDRKQGRKVSDRYAVVVRHPDGALAGQTREFGGFYLGEHGQELYEVIAHPVREVSHCPIRTLERGEQELCRELNGDWTMAEVQQLLDDQTSNLDGLEIFQDIIRQCDVLSSGPFAGKYRSPLDLAVSKDVAVSWRTFGKKSKQTPVVVRGLFRCEQCGWQWYGSAGKAHKAQCTAPGCRKNYAWKAVADR